MSEKKCPKCDGVMEEGELIDKGYGTSTPQHWSVTAGSILGLGISGGIKIRSFRCIECGYIENYAASEERKKKVIEYMENEEKRKLQRNEESDNKIKKNDLSVNPDNLPISPWN